MWDPVGMVESWEASYSCHEALVGVKIICAIAIICLCQPGGFFCRKELS